MDKLTELSEKVDRIERHLTELDDKITELYNLSTENEFIKVLVIIFIIQKKQVAIVLNY
jgi:uncharacterized protein (UPF0335 family)